MWEVDGGALGVVAASAGWLDGERDCGEWVCCRPPLDARWAVRRGRVRRAAGRRVGCARELSRGAGEIVFSSTFSGDREIYVAAADGSGRVDLTRDPQAADITPSWSPDGRRIAFASDRSGSMEIYLMNADGSSVVQLTRDGGVRG